jgi:hypothetical protein
MFAADIFDSLQSFVVQISDSVSGTFFQGFVVVSGTLFCNGRKLLTNNGYPKLNQSHFQRKLSPK